MKIVFITPSAIPGRSGVGDYSLTLASFLGRQGHAVAVVGLADPIDPQAASPEGPSPDAPFTRLLLSENQSWAERWDACGTFCRAFAPDWISLQFVSYGFDPRGLAWNLGSRLHALAHNVSWHVMFHEIWVGAKQGAPWKQRLLGLAQRASIIRTLKALRPKAVHTNNQTYRALLTRAGIEAGVLPLFGNIPIAPASEEAGLKVVLAAHGIDPDDDATRDRQLWIGLFGSLHPIWPPEPFFTYLHQAQAASGRRPVLFSIGRLGPGRELWDRLRRDQGSRCSFVELGEQSPQLISRLFHRLDCGIATTPYQLIGKSGSAAAMVEHGLPLIVNRTERYGLPSDDLPHPEPLYLPMTSDLPRLLAGLPPRRAARSTLPEVARAFLDTLGQA